MQWELGRSPQPRSTAYRLLSLNFRSRLPECPTTTVSVALDCQAEKDAMIPTGLIVKEFVPNVCELTLDELNVVLPLVRLEMAVRWGSLGSSISTPSLADAIPEWLDAPTYLRLRSEANCQSAPPRPPARHPSESLLGGIALVGGAALSALIYALWR